MAAKKKTPPPIDRPLSRAYLREFRGWSTAYPPGQSEPNSLRLMENMLIDRNGAVEVRPGLRHLTFTSCPNTDALVDSNGRGEGRPVVGEWELFYTIDGEAALLYAVREPDDSVGFRCALVNDVFQVVYTLDDPRIGFRGDLPSVLNFSSGTRYVRYLQINNRILALSDNGEDARLFEVGSVLSARRLLGISVPNWTEDHSLTVVHPDAAWINDRASTSRINALRNPSFEGGVEGWTVRQDNISVSARPDDSVHGLYSMEIRSLPQRTNLVPHPLHNPEANGWDGWTLSDGSFGSIYDEGDLSYLQVTTAGTEARATAPRIVSNDLAGGGFRLSFDYRSINSQVFAELDMQTSSGYSLGVLTVEAPSTSGRVHSPLLSFPEGTASVRLRLGFRNLTDGEAAQGMFRQIVLCADGESTEPFTGSSGPDYFWTGTPWQSASIYHPEAPESVQIVSDYVAPVLGEQLHASISISSAVNDVDYNVGISFRSPGWEETEFQTVLDTVGPLDGWVRKDQGVAGPITNNQTTVALIVTLWRLQRDDVVRLDGAMLELGATALDTYFDGSTTSTSASQNSWLGEPHNSRSEQTTRGDTVALSPETPTTGTLIASGGASSNTYKIGFFYTFQNQVGESAASQITETRISRPWSNWIWETPAADGSPSGTHTDDPYAVADQLVVEMPEDVYDQAMAEGALRWNLYAFAWSDEEPVPVVAQLVEYQTIRTDAGDQAVPYSAGGRIVVTPQRRVGVHDMVLPSQEDRMDSSAPPQHRNGTVAGDRIVLVGDPSDAATIFWSSNVPGSYTNFSMARGGGRKTLSSGNLNLPYSVVLWQNPQSVDTLTILCSDDNGMSNSFYMAPAEVQGQFGTTAIMGFEETTSTPGTVAPFGAEVLNNALYRPLDRSLMKSTANNYNINHKPMTEDIANMWMLLQSKQWIVSAQLDNRLYYLVHNPEGELLAEHCLGNEVWVYDVQAEKGHWSRFLIQGSSLKPLNIGSRTCMGIGRADGLYYLDDQARTDDVLGLDLFVDHVQIPWMFETNTQGANRAHDAWAHLQQVGVTFGNWRGSAEYGVRGHSLNGRTVDISKRFADEGWDEAAQRWDVMDALQIRRDMVEWYFYARSVPGEPGTGQIGVVQYRYTPVSVNVGYEFGSVETFEYGADPAAYSRNGIPLPYVDYSRP